MWQVSVQRACTYAPQLYVCVSAVARACEERVPSFGFFPQPLLGARFFGRLFHQGGAIMVDPAPMVLDLDEAQEPLV